jgi:hypothetical protein
MSLPTKEESSQRRKGVNIQNNSASYFRICNTELHHHNDINNQLRLRRAKSVRCGFNRRTNIISYETPLSFPAGSQSCPVRASHPPEVSFA